MDDGPQDGGRRGAPPPVPAPDAGATPRWVDELLRTAAAEVSGVGLDRVPGAQPRRPPAGAPGDFASALPLRLAGAAHTPADRLAADIAAALRAHPQVVDAAVEGRGFVNLTLTPAARVSLVRAVGDGAAYLTGGGPGTAGEPSLGAPDPGAPSAATAAQSAVGRGGAPVWALSALHTATSVEEARILARDDARRRIAHAREAVHAGADDVVRPRGRPPSSGPRQAAPATGAQASGPARIPEVSWRDPYLDERSPRGPVARLLSVTGEASARVAFCRSIPERPRRGEVTGPGLPAVPTAEAPGHWARHTDANPAFRVRYAHAHAVSTLAWSFARGWDVPALPEHAITGRTAAAAGRPLSGHVGPTTTTGLTPAAVAALDEPPAAALIGELFDGPGVLATAARRREPHILVRYLEGLAIAYHEWRESRGAAIGDMIGPETADGACGEGIAARLELCAAAAGVLGTGLSLLGVSAPTRL
nr:DALR anticodon-binding domain-containing protein [Nocardiopsis mwathae]